MKIFYSIGLEDFRFCINLMFFGGQNNILMWKESKPLKIRKFFTKLIAKMFAARRQAPQPLMLWSFCNFNVFVVNSCIRGRQKYLKIMANNHIFSKKVMSLLVVSTKLYTIFYGWIFWWVILKHLYLNLGLFNYLILMKGFS